MCGEAAPRRLHPLKFPVSKPPLTITLEGDEDVVKLAGALLAATVPALLLAIAAILDWPRATPSPAIGHSLGWLGLAIFVATFIVG